MRDCPRLADLCSSNLQWMQQTNGLHSRAHACPTDTLGDQQFKSLLLYLADIHLIIQLQAQLMKDPVCLAGIRLPGTLQVLLIAGSVSPVDIRPVEEPAAQGMEDPLSPTDIYLVAQLKGPQMKDSIH
ncbi:hypothetical protein ETB97_005369 [Aspergillus alliaceus]|uniref:Uncharacterized protein n=1 Tax=Petromyces alliaceus TaxID=209559 RepID=A0A8H6EAW9_PETAA|nr:hypothetical protein ETB97_005369 [Aspergillus burnettii]